MDAHFSYFDKVNEFFFTQVNSTSETKDLRCVLGWELCKMPGKKQSLFINVLPVVEDPLDYVPT